MKYYRIWILGLVISLSANLSSKAQDSKEEDYPVVEQIPAYPGGSSEMKTFIKKNINYPTIAKENGIKGIVYVSFIVDSTGMIQNIQLLKGLGYGLDEEAIRVVKLMPKWKPATMNGKSVSVKMTVPIKMQNNN